MPTEGKWLVVELNVYEVWSVRRGGTVLQEYVGDACDMTIPLPGLRSSNSSSRPLPRKAGSDLDTRYPEPLTGLLHGRILRRRQLRVCGQAPPPKAGCTPFYSWRSLARKRHPNSRSVRPHSHAAIERACVMRSRPSCRDFAPESLIDHPISHPLCHRRPDISTKSPICPLPSHKPLCPCAQRHRPHPPSSRPFHHDLPLYTSPSHCKTPTHHNTLIHIAERSRHSCTSNTCLDH